MVFTIDVYVHGACRGGNGVAAGVFKFRNMPPITYWHPLAANPPPTQMRAELTAIELAIDRVLAQRAKLDRNPLLNVTIYTDSKNAHDFMTVHYQKWEQNGWRNAKGNEVANRDVIERALYGERKVWEWGTVRYLVVSRAENAEAERVVNEELDRM